jgi:hypothetical protein
MAQSHMKDMEPATSNKIIQLKTNIKDLQPKDRNIILEAKVYRAWIARDPPDTTEKGFRAILLDRQVQYTYAYHLN